MAYVKLSVVSASTPLARVLTWSAGFVFLQVCPWGGCTVVFVLCSVKLDQLVPASKAKPIQQKETIKAAPKYIPVSGHQGERSQGWLAG